MEQRTKCFSLAAIKFADAQPRNRASDVLARQFLRSATSIGANYREANRGISRADFANKIGTVQKEASETQYWIELLMEAVSVLVTARKTFTKKLLNCSRSSPQLARNLSSDCFLPFTLPFLLSS